MNQETLNELFVEQLRDIYNAEQQLVKALPQLAKAACSSDLANALSMHLEETKTHVSRLVEVFAALGLAAKGKKCKGMEGLLAEGNEAIKEQEGGELRDLAIIAGCQRVEHYEISAYGTVRAVAEHLGLDDAVGLLQQSEAEEVQADSKLTDVAEMIYESDDPTADIHDDRMTAVRKGAASAHHAPAKRSRAGV